MNGVDHTRMDLVVPGEKHMYLRAASSQERQLWLVALGSCKACLTTKYQQEPGMVILFYLSIYNHFYEEHTMTRLIRYGDKKVQRYSYHNTIKKPLEPMSTINK